MVTTTTAPLSAPLSGEARFGVYGAASPKRAIRQTPGGYVRGAGNTDNGRLSSRMPSPRRGIWRQGSLGSCRCGSPDRRPGRGHDDVEGRRPARRLRRLRPELPRPHDRVRLFDSPDDGRAGLGAASLGGGWSRRAGGVHARDDARAREEGGRPHRRDVAAEDEPCPALREAPSRTTHPVGAGYAPPGPVTTGPYGLEAPQQ
jgi:hypothetical protein